MTTAEVNIIVGLHDELSLSGEYILMLVHHCYENDKRSMKYVEKMAFSLCDSGILSASDLEIYLEEIENENALLLKREQKKQINEMEKNLESKRNY